MFKTENSKEINEIRHLKHELNNPVVETEEKQLTEEESMEWLLDGINKTIRKLIKKFFEGRDDLEEFNLDIDNKDGKVVLSFLKDGEVVHSESFKA